MKKDVTIIIAEDDEGHATLIRRNLKRSGINNQILHFKDGQETIDFFFGNKKLSHRKKNNPYLLLLDIKIPKVNGIDVLQRIKLDKELCKIPVIVISTTEDPKEINRCYKIGCNYYVTKPIDYNKFDKSIRLLGLFLKEMEFPTIYQSFG